MNPFDDADAYQFVLGDRAWVGLATLTGQRQYGWDKKPAKGQVGGTSALTGTPVGEFTVLFSIVNDPSSEIDEYAEWESFQKHIESTVTPKAKALPVYHPDLARTHYTDACLDTIGIMQYDGKGGASVSVKFIEYRPPKPKAAKKAEAGAKGGSGSKSTAPDPNAARKAEVAKLTAQAEKLHL